MMISFSVGFFTLLQQSDSVSSELTIGAHNAARTDDANFMG